MKSLKTIRILLLRELYGYFCTPIAYIFLVIFLILIGIFTFGDNLGNFYERGVADLSIPFFSWHPWLFMVFVPAVGMRLWSEELQHGTLELLATMPAKLWHAIAAKFLAGTVVLALALALTLPVVISVNYLGDPDNGKILCGYLASLLLSASFLSFSSFTSACTRNQVVSFIVSLVVCLLLILSGFPPIVNILRQMFPEFITQLITSWSSYTYFDGIQRGMLDSRDLVYFACLITFGVAATWIRLKETGGTWWRIISLAVFLWGVVIIGSHHHYRLDLTEGNRHTLSEGTRKIIARIAEPVTITFYFSRSEKSVPQPIKDFAHRVDDMLNQFESASNGHLMVRRLDAQPETPVEDTLMFLGIEPQMLPGGSNYFFMGIEVVAADQSAILPFLDMNKERNLEFELARTLQQIAGGHKKTIGLISGLPVMGNLTSNPFNNRSTMKPWLFIRELKKDYIIKELPADLKAMPADLDMLLLFHPKGLSEQGKYLVDQYLLNGGNLMVMIDPLCSVEIKGRGGFYKPDPDNHFSTLEPLLSAWGVSFAPQSVVADPGYSVERATGEQPAFLELDTEAMNKEDVITATLGKIRLPYSGCFTWTSLPGITVSPLLTSSENARLISSKDILQSSELDAIIDRAQAHERHLAVKASGRFKTAFPDGAPDTTIPAAATHMDASTHPATIVLVGDVDLLEERMWSHRTFNRFTNRETLEITHDANNFLQNACEQLSGGDDLVSIRTRADLPGFTRVTKLWQEADERLRSEVLRLNAAYKETAERLKAMKNRYTNLSQYIESPEERKERETLRRKHLEIVETLKTLKRERRQAIDRLGAYLLWINVGLAPFLVALSGVGVAIWRKYN